MESTDTTPQFSHIAAGIHVGVMSMNVPSPIQAVLTVAERPGIVPDGIAHKHIYLHPIDYSPLDVADASGWVLEQLDCDRQVLIRSEGGNQRPSLVAGFSILQLGGFFDDVITCLGRAHPTYLSNPEYRDFLCDADQRLNKRLRKP